MSAAQASLPSTGVSPASAGRIADASPPEITAWAIERFGTHRLAVTTGFGMEGCALIDMVARTGHLLRITYLDTHFLFSETLRLRDRLVRRYPTLTFVNEGTPITPAEQEAVHGPELWARDPDTCCTIRKVDPMARVMADHDVWITAIRRGQTDGRASIRVVEWDWHFDVLKISPMAAWSRADVWAYIRANDVPYNELHDRGYPSLGCTHCTVAVAGSLPTTYSRAGRWAGRDKTECGLHLPSTGEAAS
ncbi:MAG: phosphoadenylyl-sulfate reductase [Gemmatimonadaceae bacterium]|nr:phosphoadenylyl-sulfate reductase [Gemmatimonadaceae bacterium]